MTSALQKKMTIVSSLFLRSSKQSVIQLQSYRAFRGMSSFRPSEDLTPQKRIMTDLPSHSLQFFVKIVQINVQQICFVPLVVGTGQESQSSWSVHFLEILKHRCVALFSKIWEKSARELDFGLKAFESCPKMFSPWISRTVCFPEGQLLFHLASVLQSRW